MSLMARAAAVVLALTTGAVPLVADWCAISCETTHAGASARAPSCHHTGGASTRIGDAQRACPNAHRPIVVESAVAATASPTTSVVPVQIVHRTETHATPLPPPFAVPSPLRI